jgi:hypothetical protein
MLMILLGVIDIIAAIMLFSSIKFGFLPQLALLFLFYLTLKAMAFINDWVSKVDILMCIVFLLALFGYSNPIFLGIATIWFLQKGIMSLF